MASKRKLDCDERKVYKSLSVKTPRFPCCTARCYLEEGTDIDIDQKSYLKLLPYEIETVHGLNYKVNNWNVPLTEDPKEYEVDEKFTEKINAILEPFQHLRHGESGYKIAENCGVPLKEQWFTMGFEANFSNQRGRIAIEKLLDKLFSTSNTISSNIGGSSACNEPSVREYIFKAEVLHSISSSSDATRHHVPVQDQSPPRKVIIKKCLVPDVVLESINKEYLVVEVKKEKIGTSSRSSLDQTKFLLIPAAMANGSAHALLINVFEAMVMTCSKTEDPPSLKFTQTRHVFTPEDLTQDLKRLLKQLCSVLSNVE